MKNLLSYKTMAFSLIALIATAAIAESADAREINRSGEGSYVTGKGKTGTFNRSATGNRKDGLTRNQSVTTNNGNTYNRSATGSYDKDTGQYNKTVTAPNGNTRTYTGTAQDGQRSGTYTTSTGKSGTYDANIQRNEDGTVTRTNNWTNQDGESKSRSVNHSYDQENKTSTRSVTGPGGNTHGATVTYTTDSQ